MFKIYDGRKEFYQWDLDQKLIVSDPTINEVHFCNQTGDCALVCEVYKEGEQRLVNVPNILLQNYYPIRAYAHCDCATMTSQTFNVIMRSKPADYAYTETEVRTWENLNERITELELGNCAITDVEVLPTEDILPRLLYRTPEGVYWFDDGWHRIVDESELEAAKKENADNLDNHIKDYDDKVKALEEADATNAKAIADEAKRAKEAESALDKKITDEIARQDGDIANATKTANEAKTTADTLDSTIQFALFHSTETRELLNDEIARSTVKDQALEDAFNELERELTALLSSDTETLNELQEIVDYIKNNKNLIDAITINKVNVADIVDHLLSLATDKPLSANQGRILNEAITAFKNAYDAKVSALEASDKSNADAIKAEAERAKTAEATLTEEVRTANEHAQNAVENATASLNTANESNTRSKQTQEDLEDEILRAKEAENEIKTDLETHISEYNGKVAELENSVGASFQAIANEIARSEEKDNEIEGRLGTVESIAKGANQAVSFGNYSTMIGVFNALPKDTYNIGQNIMIVTVQVPDLWISAIAEESVSYTYIDDETFATALRDSGSVQVGYYVLSQLETQKVDLTDYAKKGVFGYNDLQDRPFYSELLQIKYSSSDNFVNLVEGTAYLQTEKTYTLEELLGATVEYYNGNSYVDTTVLAESHVSNQTENGITFTLSSLGAYIFVVYSTDYKPNALYVGETFPTTGTYFSYWDNGDPIRVDTLTKEQLKQLDNKYLDLPANTDFANLQTELETNYVKKTDTAVAGGAAGLVKLTYLDSSGLQITPQGLRIGASTTAQIDAKSNAYRPITPSVLDYAVKVGVTTNKKTLTDEEKASAQKWLGVTDIVNDIKDGTIVAGKAYSLASIIATTQSGYEEQESLPIGSLIIAFIGEFGVGTVYNILVTDDEYSFSELNEAIDRRIRYHSIDDGQYWTLEIVDSRDEVYEGTIHYRII